jgi:phage-related tail protein
MLFSNPKTPASPPDPKQVKKQIDRYRQDQKQIADITKSIDKSIDEVNTKMQNTFGKSAKFICLLRLDMVADQLENINSRMASRVDDIANDLEKDWEE